MLIKNFLRKTNDHKSFIRHAKEAQGLATRWE